MLNMKNWQEVKRWFKTRKFKLVSNADTDSTYKSLFLKDNKLAVVSKPRRGKIVRVTWFDWTNMKPTEELLNETYCLEESACKHKEVEIEYEV